MSFVGKMQPFSPASYVTRACRVAMCPIRKHQGTQRRPSQAWIRIFKAPLKKALLRDLEDFLKNPWFNRPSPPKKIMAKDSSHGMCFFCCFFLSLGGWRLRFLYICQGFGKVVDLGAELKSWCPRKKGYDDGRSGKKKSRHGKAWSFLNFCFHPFFVKMYSSFVPSWLRIWWMGWWGWFSWKSLDEDLTTRGFLIPKESWKKPCGTSESGLDICFVRWSERENLFMFHTHTCLTYTSTHASEEY